MLGRGHPLVREAALQQAGVGGLLLCNGNGYLSATAVVRYGQVKINFTTQRQVRMSTSGKRAAQRVLAFW